MGLFDLLKRKKQNEEKEITLASDDIVAEETVGESETRMEKDAQVEAPDTVNGERVRHSAVEETTNATVYFADGDFVVTMEEPAYIVDPVAQLFSFEPTKMTDYIETQKIDVTNPVVLLSACLGKVSAIQGRYASTIVNDRQWEIELEQGKITFEDGESYPIQFIGTQETEHSSWLWGWHNMNGFPANVLSLAQRMQAIGEVWQSDILRYESHFLAEGLTGHDYAIITCGLADGYAYQVAHYEKGTAFVGISNLPIETFAPVDALKFIANTQHCIANLTLDHKIFVESFLHWNDTDFEWDGLTLRAHFEQDVELKFEQTEAGMQIASFTTNAGNEHGQ